VSDDPHAPCLTAAPDDVRARLQAIQAEVERRVPSATRDNGYRMPSYRVRRIFFYFSPFKKHIGVYPPVTGPDALLAKLAPYRGPKGNLSFPHDQPLPLHLIGEAAAHLAEQYG
jgi:uncharacterized protein YdhG (YjbR/CyaY superfamily)